MDIFDKLANSKFRSKFKLKEKEKLYIEEKGIETIKSHAKDFISKRIGRIIRINKKSFEAWLNSRPE